MPVQMNARETLKLMKKASRAASSPEEFRDIQEVKRELTRLHRRLIDEENEEELLFLFRETKRLKKVIEVMAAGAAAGAAAASDGASGSAVQPKASTRKQAPPPVAPRKKTSDGAAVVAAAPSADGEVRRSMFLPGQSGGAGAAAFDDPSQLPPPPPPEQFAGGPAGSGEGEDVLAGMDPASFAEFDYSAAELPPPPPELEAPDYFVCCQCQKEAYGEVDERDGNFYCGACWAEYSRIGGGGETGAGDGGGDGGGGGGAQTVNDPTHPDYWKNLKERSMRGDAPPSSGDSTDVFAQFLASAPGSTNGAADAASNAAADRGDGGAAASPSDGGAPELDVVVDAMLARIQDKRKSMRFDKGAKGKRFFKKKEPKKRKKNKVDPRTLFAEQPLDLGAHGLLVKSPANALPIPPPQPAAVKPLKPLRPVVLFGEVGVDGTVWRAVYHHDDYVIECGRSPGANGHQEVVRPATEDWEAKGLPVRLDLNPFILDEFGGVVDTNALGASGPPPPVAPPDYT